jgi:hypothetical protein
MELTCTALVESRNTGDGSRGKFIDPVKNMYLYHCLTFFPPVAICDKLQIITSLMLSLCTAVTTKTTQNYCDISHAQSTTTVQRNVFLV